MIQILVTYKLPTGMSTIFRALCEWNTSLPDKFNQTYNICRKNSAELGNKYSCPIRIHS